MFRDLPDNIIDLTKSMEELFIDFFKSKKGQLPDETDSEYF